MLHVAWLIPCFDVDNGSCRIRRILPNHGLNKLGHDSYIIRDYYEIPEEAILAIMVQHETQVAVYASFSEYDYKLMKLCHQMNIKCVFDHCECLFGFPFEHECMKEADMISCCSTKLTEITKARGYPHAVYLPDCSDPPIKVLS